MSQLIQKRVTGRMEGDFVVFLIGMRINRWWKFWHWLRVMAQMPKMMRELQAQPELGYLGGDMWIGRTIIAVQYWRSSEHLMKYARAKDAKHLPAWSDFNKRIGTNGDVGIWHETYLVRAGEYEAIYGAMPRQGLAAAGRHVAISGAGDTARGRAARQHSASTVT